MSIQFTQSRLRPLALAIAVSSAIVCQSASAQELAFSLPEQSLATSVAEISRQGQIQLIYDKGQLNGFEHLPCLVTTPLKPHYKNTHR